MKRIPLIPMIVVALAVLLMIGLGLWQLRRAEWKEGLLARYAQASRLPPMAWPAVPPTDGSLLFRRAGGFCLQPTGWTARAGRNRAGESGWRHIAACRTGGAEGPGLNVDMGWSKSADPPKSWRGGRVTGVIESDREHVILLVSDRAAPGLEPSALPSPEQIPNNHRAYAVQWFLFAGVALIISGLAFSRRGREPKP
ncbi:hypothetical protein CLG96_10480 [Sphingomonas oleivorans]|uniref:SURF1-like protein n=1 Tax=Sphingomonas oleivorans TaxID=1735121 RepID=A0A2T5FXE8_9SPHN|nr:SURF1 family protein [Sphingomonas oleivorans]PTQ10815.1 hypothetical protein CLG96_10480 [Sphingomonas oleivorans]